MTLILGLVAVVMPMFRGFVFRSEEVLAYTQATSHKIYKLTQHIDNIIIIDIAVLIIPPHTDQHGPSGRPANLLETVKHLLHIGAHDAQPRIARSGDAVVSWIRIQI
jgi:hypothetical protein